MNDEEVELTKVNSKIGDWFKKGKQKSSKRGGESETDFWLMVTRGRRTVV